MTVVQLQHKTKLLAGSGPVKSVPGAGNEEHREWWEIESIEDGVMKWKALRKNADGTTYTATFEMSKVTE